jgi:hypothetical protein
VEVSLLLQRRTPVPRARQPAVDAAAGIEEIVGWRVSKKLGCRRNLEGIELRRTAGPIETMSKEVAQLMEWS